MSQIDFTGKPRAAVLGNVTALLEAADRLRNRPDGIDGIGCMFGPSGYGKSFSASVVVAETDARWVEVKSSWTKKKFLQEVAKQLGVPTFGTMTDLSEAVGEELARSQRLLIVDECDILADKNAIEVVRELYMNSGAPIILIGEEKLPAKIKRWERLATRISLWVPAQPATLEDARELAGMYLDKIQIADDLLAHITKECRGQLRRMVNACYDVEILAVRAGMDVADRAWWGSRPVQTGAAPSRSLPE